MGVKLLILVMIVCIKGIFAAAETSFTYLNKAKFNQMSKYAKKKTGRKILRIKQLLDNKLRIFGTTKIGMTFAELFASIFVAETFVDELEQKFEIIGLETMPGYILSLIIITIILSYITLVFGELIPRRIARNNPEKVAYRTVNIITMCAKINYVFEKILVASENAFSKIFGIKNEPNEKLTEKEIKMIIAEGKDQGILDEDEKRLLYNALKFDDVKIKDIMIPKEKMICINIDSPEEKILEIIGKYKYTRIPVYSGNRNNIIGILNVKDVLLNSIKEKGQINIDLKEILREPTFVKKKENIDEIFRTMQLNSKHIIIIKTEDGRVEGMVTMEDMIEKLLGNIVDEFNR